MKYENIQDIIDAKEMMSPIGDTIAETLACKGISQQELALNIGMTTKAINEVIKGIAKITPKMATKLERALGIDAAFWIEREKNYRKELANMEEYKQILAHLTHQEYI